ncbi:hypothetical protein DFA_05286 [Cavenderia fasciculata]|uniref:tRNA-intron lyase n=1 Tax=Cavenderia fasciculata TaxID=261658 RepID=F4PNV1_CACFS|nr:uncharacterized protein DFA_05286 [Cavenderia fasciculata]EGG23154.1 hypothetical protein DFA_05286 [Cavenderia fasciculata]|eukprot:XP_004361005.1 hypothetical protein DFA_05286 [Cavenderia fasciculata]
MTELPPLQQQQQQQSQGIGGGKHKKKHNGLIDNASVFFPTSGPIKHYFALFIGYAVKLFTLEDGIDLYRHGCFGKGNLSRSEPVYNSRSNNSNGGGDQKRVTKGGFHIKKKVKINNQNNQNNNTNNNNNNATASTENNENITFEEYLQLSLYEAFYLSYSFGCLTILRYPNDNEIDEIEIEEKGEEKEEKLNLRKYVRMTIEECWIKFNQYDKSFLYGYIVYHHFRSIGWIVRSGLKYGCDFVLYKLSPELIHAQYAIIAKPTKELLSLLERMGLDTRTMEGLSPKIDETWESLSCMNRVSENVSKGIIICNVLTKDKEEKELEIIKSLEQIENEIIREEEEKLNIRLSLLLVMLSEGHFKINIWSFNRWLPTKARINNNIETNKPKTTTSSTEG